MIVIDMMLPVIVDLRGWTQGGCQAPWDREVNRDRQAALGNGERPAPRESQVPRDRRALQGQWGQEESLAYAGRRVPLVIRKIVYLHHFWGRG